MSHEPTWPQDATMPAGITHPLTRREWLVSAAALAAVAGSSPLTVRSALAQTSKRGGTLTVRLWDPPHWDPYLIIAFKTQIPYTFTHSRLLRHKAGPAIQPGTFPLEGDLAESCAPLWTIRKPARHALPTSRSHCQAEQPRR